MICSFSHYLPRELKNWELWIHWLPEHVNFAPFYDNERGVSVSLLKIYNSFGNDARYRWTLESALYWLICPPIERKGHVKTEPEKSQTFHLFLASCCSGLIQQESIYSSTLDFRASNETNTSPYASVSSFFLWRKSGAWTSFSFSLLFRSEVSYSDDWNRALVFVWHAD